MPSDQPPYPCLFPDRLAMQHVLYLPVIVDDTSRVASVGTVELRTVGPKPNRFGVDWTDLIGALPSPAPFSSAARAVHDLATLPAGCTMERVGDLRRGQDVRWLNVRLHGDTTGARYHGKVVSVTVHEGVATVELADTAGVPGRVTVMADDTVIVGPK